MIGIERKFERLLMAAQVLQFPNSPLAVSRPYSGRVSVARRNYGFDDLVALLCLRPLAPRAQVQRLRLMASCAGLPLPRNPRVWGQQIVTGPDSICRASIWCALEIDAWIDMQGNPPPAAPASNPNRINHCMREEMRARAGAL